MKAPNLGPIVPKLGLMVIVMSITAQAISLGDALFSKTQQKVIGLLFGKPNQSYFANEIVRSAGLGKGTVMRELERLHSSGLVTLVRQGNQNHYQANSQSPIFQELTAIARKTFGIADLVKDALQPINSKLQTAFIYGSIAKGEATSESDIDLMLVGIDISYAEVMDLLSATEENLGRTINPTIYTPQDFQTKLSSGNNFLVKVMEQPRIQLKVAAD